MTRASILLLVLLCLLFAAACGKSEGDQARSQNNQLEQELENALASRTVDPPVVDCMRPRPEHHLCTVYVAVSGTHALVAHYAVYDCEINWRARLRSTADDLHFPVRIEGDRDEDSLCP